MQAKICGVKDKVTLDYIINHKHPPTFVGFICNYPKSKRYLEFFDLQDLINIQKKNIKFVAVLVKPDENFLKKIKDLNFEYFQLYDVDPEETKIIKNKYKKKIISAITIKNIDDVKKYKNYEKISDIILFDSKGYEKSMSFDHSLIKDVPKKLKKMLAGDIKYNDDLEKYLKIADIIDLSGSLETHNVKDLSKINIFLNNLQKLNDKN